MRVGFKVKGRSTTPDPANAPSDSAATPSFTHEMGAIQLGPPMSINPLPGCNQGAHLVQIDVRHSSRAFENGNHWRYLRLEA